MKNNDKKIIGRYEILRTIGRGSQGSVELGRDPVLDRFVAVKILTDRHAELNTLDADGTPLEARIAGKLKHRNIVPIFDAGETGGQPYLVFDYVEGTTLAEHLKKNGSFSIEQAVPLIAGTLQGVAAAHEAQILHLDLSPRNIMVDADNVARVMDFGLSQYVNYVDDDDDMISGTLTYMSPEHLLGKPLGPYTDVFALGGTFYELVTGSKAMRGMTVEQVQLQIIAANIDYEPVRKLPHGDAFVRFLQGALERDFEGRYASAAVMVEAFSVFLKESGLGSAASDAEGSHSTIEFLMRRMQRKADFPTVSSTLSDINRLTGDDAEGCADQLSNVILRDFALTSKLLRLVNSAFYGTRSSEITSVSQAVVFLGVEQVRMTANSLTFFGHLSGDSAQLKDSLTRSFLSGLVARHLAKKLGLPDAEEGFIAGLCQNLGENLAIFYFPEEYEDIQGLQAEKNMTKAAASRGILGVNFNELGAAVAKSWNLPGSILNAVRGLPPGPVSAPANDAEALRNVAIFANELCQLFESRSNEQMKAEINWLVRQFEPSMDIDREYCVKLIAAGFQKLKQYAPIFEISVEGSAYCRAVKSWLDLQIRELPQDEAGMPARAQAAPGRDSQRTPVFY